MTMRVSLAKTLPLILGGQEAEGNPNELIPSNQAGLKVLTREINDLHK